MTRQVFKIQNSMEMWKLIRFCWYRVIWITLGTIMVRVRLRLRLGGGTAILHVGSYLLTSICLVVTVCDEQFRPKYVLPICAESALKPQPTNQPLLLM